MYEKRTITRSTYKLVKGPIESYDRRPTIHIIKGNHKIVEHRFEVYDRSGFARIVIVDGFVKEASCATWKKPISNDKEKVLKTTMQISVRAFIDVYKALNKKSHWLALANVVLDNKKQKLATKNNLTKADKEVLKL